MVEWRALEIAELDKLVAYESGIAVCDDEVSLVFLERQPRDRFVSVPVAITM